MYAYPQECAEWCLAVSVTTLSIQARVWCCSNAVVAVGSCPSIAPLAVLLTPSPPDPTLATSAWAVGLSSCHIRNAAGHPITVQLVHRAQNGSVAKCKPPYTGKVALVRPSKVLPEVATRTLTWKRSRS
jgi:hypothetical protein